MLLLLLQAAPPWRHRCSRWAAPWCRCGGVNRESGGQPGASSVCAGGPMLPACLHAAYMRMPEQHALPLFTNHAPTLALAVAGP